MKELIITEKEEGQRLDRLVQRYLPGAGTGFLQKMIRKKNITVNGKRAEGIQHLKNGDKIQIWFSDETLEKFGASPAGRSTAAAVRQQSDVPIRLNVVYEDEHMVFVNKPAGMLSQKAAPSDISLCEYLIDHLLEKGSITDRDLELFRPSVCNRLDRGTSGLVACGASVQGLQQLSSLIKKRQVRKFYRCLAAGRIEKSQRLDGWLVKDHASNTVRILDHPEPDAKRIVTVYTPLAAGRTDSIDWTYLEVELITGRSHQIRAHLASVGHPLLGDRRYGDMRINARLQSRFRVRDQLLHAFRMEFPADTDGLDPSENGTVTGKLAGKTLTAPVPPVFESIMKGNSR